MSTIRKGHMETSPERFIDENITLGNFSWLILVHCPKCEGRAEIKTDPATHHTHLCCINCGFVKEKQAERFDLSLKRYCDNCGHHIEVHVPNLKRKKEKIKIRCSACQTVREYEPNHSSYSLLFSDLVEGNDPHFGLSLWLKANFKQHVLWAYNFDHLDYLERYISAKLREQNPQRLHWTMIERLPGFIQSAKNRPALIALIKKLKSKL